MAFGDADWPHDSFWGDAGDRSFAPSRSLAGMPFTRLMFEVVGESKEVEA